MATPDQENVPGKSAEAEKPLPPSRPTRARTALGTTLAVFFTITGVGAAFQATCLATTAATSDLVAGISVGIVSAMIAAGALVHLFWNAPASPPRN